MKQTISLPASLELLRKHQTKGTGHLSFIGGSGRFKKSVTKLVGRLNHLTSFSGNSFYPASPPPRATNNNRRTGSCWFGLSYSLIRNDYPSSKVARNFPLVNCWMRSVTGLLSKAYLFFWSAVTCHRFCLRRLDTAFRNEPNLQKAATVRNRLKR